jgi:hypothetical protein
MSKKKTKPGYSELVEDFFFEIHYYEKYLHGAEWDDPAEPGRIIKFEPDPPDCSPAILRIAEALDAIVNDCVDADKAFGIERFRGGPMSPYKQALAWQIHKWRNDDPPWTWHTIERAVNTEWLQKNGYDIKPDEKALQKIYKESGLSDNASIFPSSRDSAKFRAKTPRK